MPVSISSVASSFLRVLLAVTAIRMGAGCNSHRDRLASSTRPPDSSTRAGSSVPTLRVYYLIDLDGYLEPCGCQKRPLGGIDRLAKLMEAQHDRAPHSLFVAAGDLLYRDPTLDSRMVFQESAKAEAVVRILDQLHLAAYAPGPADFVRGTDAWRQVVSAGHAVPLISNAQGAPLPPARSLLVEQVGSVRVGIVGISDFRESIETPAPAGAPATTDPVAAARAGVEQARSQGARLIVVLASVPRRTAHMIAQNVQGVDFVVAAREESSVPPPPERVGDGYLLTAANQGKSLGMIDVYLRDNHRPLIDASEATAASARTRLDERITDLRERISVWERDSTADRAAVEQQRLRLGQMQRERSLLTGTQIPPRGSYFVARVQEVAPELPKQHDVEQTIASYFQTVNLHNRDSYSHLRTPRVTTGHAGYVGMEACRDCHAEAFDIWVRTPHSRAYHTLEAISKNFNLSCVSCHVTGYQRPGGAEVVQNEGFRDIQCESCHGPGSLHVAARTASARRATIRRQVPGTFCASECHTPEHSDHFDYAQYLPKILGPGHGYPADSDGGGVSLDAAILAGGATPPRAATTMTMTTAH